MPQIKSQMKRALTNLKRSTAVTAYDLVNAKLDQAVSSGIHHKNYAARQKARLSKLVNSL